MVLLLSFGFLYQNAPGEPIALKTNYLEPESFEVIEYGAVPVFSKNLRFNHNLISYYIDNGCDLNRRASMIEAFNLFSDEMNLISFYEINVVEDADISVGCSDDYINLGERLFAAGEGGPSRIINTSTFKTIEKGKIQLYNGADCNYPIVEMHELLHVFGFDHSPDPKNIMYNVSDCDQRISDDMVELINELYSIEALPDVVINDLTAVKKGSYLDFNISILNDGLVGIDEIALTIFGDGKEVQVFDLGELDIGYGRTLRAENVKLPSRSIDVIEFIVDAEDLVREMSEDNNAIEMSVA